MVGEATLNAGAARTWATEASARAGYDLLVLTAAALVEAEGDVDLALGLPLGVWIRGKPERKALRSRLEGFGAWISVDGAPARHIEIRSVRVYPQSLGAYLAVMQGSEGWRLVGRPVGVIDIGYRTCDYLLVTPRGGAPAPDEERSGSVDLGIGQAYDAVRETLASQTGGLPPPESLVEEGIAGSGTLHYRGSEIALRPLWDVACRKLAGEVEAVIRRVWADRVDYLAAIVLAGGGAEAVREYLSLPAVFPVPEAIWANAVGFLTLLGTENSVARRV